MTHQEVASLSLAIILSTVLWAGSEAQSDCTNVLISMSPCLTYISGNSSSPSGACCTQLRTVVGSQPRCLCQVLDGGGSNLGLNINRTQALAMPRACNVQTPSTSLCNAAASPTGSPGSTIWSGSEAQSNCTNVLISMSPCLTYISGNTSSPSGACCTQLRTVVGSQPQCLCQVLDGGGSNLGLNINRTQALAMPRACNVQTPSTSLCNAAASPTGSPGSTTPASPNTNSGGGSRTVTSNNRDGTSDANSNKMGVPMLFFIVFVASYAVSTFTIV